MNPPIKVLSFNVLHPRWASEYKDFYPERAHTLLLDADRRQRTSLNFINSQDIDVVLLQEVHEGYLNELRKNPKWVVGPLVSPLIKGVRQSEGVAIALKKEFVQSKPVVGFSFNSFQASENEEKENVAICLLDGIAFVCAHGEWSKDGKETTYSKNFWTKLDYLLENIHYRPDAKVVVGGDWNFEPHTEAFNLLNKNATQFAVCNQQTYLGEPQQILDHFFLRNMKFVQPLLVPDNKKLRNSLRLYGSDHLPVIAYVQSE